jgi:hypothetical protein
VPSTIASPIFPIASAPRTKNAERTPKIDLPNDLLLPPRGLVPVAPPVAGPVAGPVARVGLGLGPHIVQLVRFGPKAAEAAKSTPIALGGV